MALINLGNVHTLFSPTKVIFGNGSAHNIAQEVRQLGGKKVFIVTDPEIERADLLKPIKESLRHQRYHFPFSIG